MTGKETTADREFVLMRDYDVPARFLFEAYSKAEHVKRWFGPKDWPLTTCEVDFRVGGRYRFAMTGPGGQKDAPFGGEYLEIVTNRKIVYDMSTEEPGAQKIITTVTFEEAGGKTRLVMHMLFASKAMRDDYVGPAFTAGINSGLDQLADVAAELKRKAKA